MALVKYHKIVMEEKVLALTYDNKIVRIPREKLEEFKATQVKIKKLLEEGKTQKEVLEVLKNDK